VKTPLLEGTSLDGGLWTATGPVIIVGAFGLAAMSEIGVWTKLLDSAQFDSKFLLIARQSNSQLLKAIRTSFAPSRLADIVVAENNFDSWIQLIQPDRPERAFAAHIVNQVATTLMIGPPTEEGWDLFQAQLTAPYPST